MWPGVGIKRSPTFPQKLPKCSHSNFKLKDTFFKIAQKVTISLGYFWNKICYQDLYKNCQIWSHCFVFFHPNTNGSFTCIGTRIRKPARGSLRFIEFAITKQYKIGFLLPGNLCLPLTFLFTFLSLSVSLSLFLIFYLFLTTFSVLEIFSFYSRILLPVALLLWMEHESGVMSLRSLGIWNYP